MDGLVASREGILVMFSIRHILFKIAADFIFFDNALIIGKKHFSHALCSFVVAAFLRTQVNCDVLNCLVIFKKFTG